MIKSDLQRDYSCWSTVYILVFCKEYKLMMVEYDLIPLSSKGRRYCSTASPNKYCVNTVKYLCVELGTE